MGTKASINKGLSDSLKLAFPKVTQTEKLMVKDNKIPDPQWLAGFSTGEGCFYIKITKSSHSKQGFYIQLIFQLSQHSRDESLMRSLISYFNSGNVFKNQDTYIYDVSKFSDLNSKIIPFFNENKILGIKSEDYLNWCKVAELVKEKKHLTKDGLDQIIKIKEILNKKDTV